MAGLVITSRLLPTCEIRSRGTRVSPSSVAIHVFLFGKDVDARHRVYTWAGQRPDPSAGHDELSVAKHERPRQREIHHEADADAEELGDRQRKVLCRRD